MTIQLSEAAKNAIIDLIVHGDLDDHEFVLCTDGSFTEVTDGAYSRYALSGVAAASGGQLVDTIPMDVGADVATHWQVRDGTDTMVGQGPLSTPFTGSKTLDLFSDAIGT